jgi:hypothetical protein
VAREVCEPAGEGVDGIAPAAHEVMALRREDTVRSICAVLPDLDVLRVARVRVGDHDALAQVLARGVGAPGFLDLAELEAPEPILRWGRSDLLREQPPLGIGFGERGEGLPCRGRRLETGLHERGLRRGHVAVGREARDCLPGGPHVDGLSAGGAEKNVACLGCQGLDVPAPWEHTARDGTGENERLGAGGPGGTDLDDVPFDAHVGERKRRGACRGTAAGRSFLRLRHGLLGEAGGQRTRLG